MPDKLNHVSIRIQDEGVVQGNELFEPSWEFTLGEAIILAEVVAWSLSGLLEEFDVGSLKTGDGGGHVGNGDTDMRD